MLLTRFFKEGWQSGRMRMLGVHIIYLYTRVRIPFLPVILQQSVIY